LLKVNVGKTEPVEAALKRLLKKVQKAGVIAEMKRREYYESSELRKKRRKAAAIRKNRKKAGLPL
jgi:small subunit ribosomal protein S21